MAKLIDIFHQVNMSQGILETLYMVFCSTVLSYLIGLPLGIFSVITDEGGLMPKKNINKGLGVIINLGRSVPFIILMIALTPLTRLIIGKSWGSTAAIVPLTIAAIPFVSRLIESTLKEVDDKLIESAICMGASPLQIILKVYLVESIPSIIRGLSITTITLIGYSAMAGAVGGGGLGNIAITYGYYRFDSKIMIITLVILVLMVEIIQVIFENVTKKIDKSKR